MVSKTQILERLKAIEDPDLKKDIVSLGFVKNIKIRDSFVALDIELTTPACPIKATFQSTAEKILLSLDGITQVNVNMTSRKMKNQNQMDGLKDVPSIIAVASCKGGVGKSTIAANLARELSERGYAIGLLDADIFGPSVPTLFNMHDPHIYADHKNMLIPIECNGLKIMSFGFLLGERPAIMRGPMISKYMQQMLHNVKWEKLDYLIIDMPPGTGDIQLTLTQSIQLSGAIIVTTRQSLSIADVAKGIEMFEKVNVPMLGIIENMSYFLCDGCGKKHFIFGNGDENTALEEKFGLETLAQLPVIHEITERLDRPLKNPYIGETAEKMVRALGKSQFREELRPTINFDDESLYVSWPDAKKSKIRHFDLRESCPCAVCVNEFTGEKTIKKRDIRRDIKPEEIVHLGNYALQIVWNDGHSSGIYPYNLIHKLGTIVA